MRFARTARHAAATSVAPARTDGRVPALEARSLDIGYGDVPMVRGLDLEVHPGEIVTILGANGAGKTTTLLGLSGELTPSAGTVSMGGAVVTTPLHRRCRAGLGFVAEDRAIIPSLSLEDNLRLGPGGVGRALALFPELEPFRKRRASLLSGGQQQMLTVGRALAAEPTVLLADEVSLGLAPLIVQRLFDAFRAAAEQGAAIVMVEQQARLALRNSTRAYVLSRGRLALHGDSADLLERFAEVESHYLDSAVAEEIGAA